MTAIYPFFAWCERTAVHRAITDHESFFPALETIHLFGLVLLMGTTVLLSLRLLGVMMPRQPVAELAHELASYATGGLLIMLASGALMFIATAVRCYSNASFWVKMSALAAALLFHFTVFRKAVHSPRAPERRDKLVGCAALILWFSVAAAGRSIGFVG